MSKIKRKIARMVGPPLYLSIVIVIMMFFSGCNKENKYPSLVIGTWSLDDSFYTHVSFLEDGTFIAGNQYGGGSGIYTLSGRQLYLTDYTPQTWDAFEFPLDNYNILKLNKKHLDFGEYEFQRVD